MTGIDIEGLRDARKHSALMVAHYGKTEKAAQNAALEAAGLKPLHSERALEWDSREGARYQRQVDALDAAIALLSAEFGPDEAIDCAEARVA